MHDEDGGGLAEDAQPAKPHQGIKPHIALQVPRLVEQKAVHIPSGSYPWPARPAGGSMP